MLERSQAATRVSKIQTWIRGGGTAIGSEPRTQKASVTTSRQTTSPLVFYVRLLWSLTLSLLLLVTHGELTHLKQEQAHWIYRRQDVRSVSWHTFLLTGYPGPPSAPKVAGAFKDHIDLTWSRPCDNGGTKILGYNLEKKKKGTNYWSLVNQSGPITGIQHVWNSKHQFLMLSQGCRLLIPLSHRHKLYSDRSIWRCCIWIQSVCYQSIWHWRSQPPMWHRNCARSTE